MQDKPTDLEVLLEELRRAHADSPTFGSIVLAAHFVDGRLIRFERSRSESVKAPGDQA